LHHAPFLLFPIVAAVAGVAGGPALAQDRADDRRLARFDVPGASDDVNQSLARVLDSVRRADVIELAIDRDDDERRLRRLRELAIAALATEGYFTPEISAAPDRDADGRPGEARYVLKIELGPRVIIGAVDIVMSGVINAQPQRRDALIAAWELPKGAPFRDAAWNTAKLRLLTRLQDKDFAAAQIVGSSAEVDVDAGTVVLRVEIDSGPAFKLGALQVTGLKRYDLSLVERFNPFRPGDRYDATQLLDFQRRMQSSPYFSSVLVSVEPDPERAVDAPIDVKLSEAQRKRVQFGVGYSTNTGARVEATYRQAQIFGYPYTLQSGVGIDQTRSIIYGDILLPPKPNGALDSVGGLFERTDIDNVITHRWGTGAARAQLRESDGASIETKLSFNLERELRRFTDRVAGDPAPSSQTNDVLSTTWTWTRRAVDDITDPRRGSVMSVSLSAGLGREFVESLSDNTFTRAYGRLSLYLPPPWLDPKRNVLILRGEAGRVFTDDPTFIPSDFLFRAGGAGSLRGYAYRSIGRPARSTRAGGTALAVGSVEGVHWFTPEWGGALFFDIGDAADDFDEMRTPGRAGGFGVRWKTVAGPIAFDVAYGERRPDAANAPPPPNYIGGRWRLHFSVAIAF
jgi:translocation and assembly module TamA